MEPATDHVDRDLRVQYTEALRRYLAGEGESALHQAYEIGHRVINSGLSMSVLKVISLYHLALMSLLEQTRTPVEGVKLATQASDFFTETMSPFEMAIRGYQDAISNLKSLNEKLKESESQIHVQFAQLKELDQLKTNFVNSVSHDLRTPITTIMGFAEFLEDELGGPLTPRQREFVLQIERSAKRLEDMVNDLLDFARADAGTLRLRLEEADLGAVIREVERAMMPAMQQHQLTLEVSIEADPIVVRMDTDRVERVVTNLLQNAAKFTPGGGLIRLRLRQEGDFALCEVEDTGVGIAEEDLSKLFQRFSQLEAGARKGGTGLGLSICKMVVDAHGGDIGVRSRPGVGSTFWFRLPLAGPPQPAEGHGDMVKGGVSDGA